MTRSKWLVMAAAVVVFAGAAWAQEVPPDAGAPAAAPGNALPDLGQMMEVLDRATAPQEAGEGEGKGDWSAPVRLAVVFTLLALLPSLLVMMTAFTRVVIVLAFIRRALTTQNIPPTIAVVGLALFLTLFIMAPPFAKMNESAVQPFLRNEIALPDALTRGERVMKQFMLLQLQHREEDLALFMDLSRTPPPENPLDLPSYVVVPAFAISEFRVAFEMGALLFVPFLLVDLVISAILLATGMMMLPPSMVSLPFKIILFVLVDGWRLIAETLVNSFTWGAL